MLRGDTFLAGVPKEWFVTKTLEISFTQGNPRKNNPLLQKPLRSQPMKTVFQDGVHSIKNQQAIVI